jgi:hypothetical protein
VVGSTEILSDTGIGAITDVLGGRWRRARRRCIGGSGARTFDKTPHINIYPEVMFEAVVHQGRYSLSFPSECLNLFGRRLARSIRTFKQEHERVRWRVDGRTSKKFLFFNFMICKSKVKRKS